jgi:hypothetical protein
MALDYSSLTDRALCDAATAEIDFRLKTFATRDMVGDLADDRADRSQTTVAAQLTDVNARIAVVDAILAAPGIGEKQRTDSNDERAALLVRRTALTKRNQQTTGLDRFLGDVDAEQIDSQLATLGTVKAGIATHRATLPA